VTDGSAGRYVDAGGVRTYYEVEGEGEPLVLLHGGFATIETWAAQRAALTDRYRVFLPERRGHGRTADVPGPTGFDVMAADMLAFMSAVGIGPVHLVGWSDGGIVALEVALARPDVVRRLVLGGTAAHVDGYTTETKERMKTMTPDDLPAFVRERYDTLSPDGPGHFAVVFQKLMEVWRTQPRHDAAELARVTAPTLIMLGDKDVLTVEHAALMLRAMPNAQLAVIPGADHGVVFAKADLVNRLIQDFLDDAQAS
jgi:pimeloyl-ACP methyl ester carboxylesterase